MVADCGATCAKYLLCLFNFVFFVSIYSHYCCLFIYKDILLHQRGSILSQENAEKLSNFRQLQWAFFCQV